MSKLIQTTDGSFVLSSEIVEVTKRRREKCDIKTRQKTSHKVDEYATRLASVIEYNSGMAIPAQPGYSIIFVYEPKDKQAELEKHFLPVVGWSTSPSTSDYSFLFESVPIIPGIYELSSD